jgi:acyl carrier protein
MTDSQANDSRASVEERVIKAIGKVAKSTDIKVDNTFEELHVDSLDAIEILFEVEEEFDINIPGNGVRSIRTVRDVVDGVTRLLAGDTGAFGGGKAPEQQVKSAAPPAPGAGEAAEGAAAS